MGVSGPQTVLLFGPEWLDTKGVAVWNVSSNPGDAHKLITFNYS
jgi:hypothetical protein